jgi:hypothetical protein
MTALVKVPFHGDEILCVATPDGVYVAVRPLCERLGLSWPAQFRRLTSEKERWGVAQMATPSVGGEQETTCIPANRVAAWLFVINANRVKPELRDTIRAYQREAADVLDRHFRLRQAEERAEIEAMRDRLARAGNFLQAFHPLWGRIAALQRAKVDRAYVFRHLNRSFDDTLAQIQAMEVCGAIDPDGWWQGEDEDEPEAFYKISVAPEAGAQPRR